MKYSVKADIDKIESECNFTDRQKTIFHMHYIDNINIAYIADELGYSKRLIDKELYTIRKKIERIVR